ncbi:hypothetical protein ACBY01_15590 [Sphingomonas sp. ac-8]|uniref:hypothetical protein n=1 Tax=Sphingomonas sp. ac-8 TaxID=3242977 RepID=UPI003A7F9049
MMNTHMAALVVASLTMAACNAAPADGERMEGANAAAAASATTAPQTPPSDVPVPSARDILRASFGGTERGRYDAQKSAFVEQDEATPEVLWTEVWHRLTFTSGGKRYFTGLTSAAQADAEGTSGQPVSIALGQATFVLENGQWRAVDSGFVGQLNVNASGNPARIDTDQSRVPSPHVLADGRVVFAIRMTDFAQGTSLQSHAVLLFDPRGMAPVGASKPGYPNGGWSLVGILPTGSDNDAACEGGAVLTCAADSGTLRFEPSGTGLPDIRVQRTGTEIVAPGKVRQLGPDDTQLYRYDRAEAEYVVQRAR